MYICILNISVWGVQGACGVYIFQGVCEIFKVYIYILLYCSTKCMYVEYMKCLLRCAQNICGL